MTTTEIYLIAMAIIFSVPYLVWRIFRTDYFAPLVVVQIIAGILLGPGVLGQVFPDYYKFVFSAPVVQSLNGVAWWAVTVFVWIAGIELDLEKAWEHRGESSITAGLALGTPLVFGCVAAVGMLAHEGWIGKSANQTQFVLGVGMACAVTALPILILLMEKMQILRQPIGQLAAAVLLAASVSGKLIGVRIAGRLLKWQPGEASIIGWLLQTKALIMIIFANILLDKAIITNATFTALLLMAVASTMLTTPVVVPKLGRMKELIFRSR